MKRLEQFFPVGIEPKQEFMWMGLGLGAAFLYSAGFLIALGSAYQNLFSNRGGVRRLLERAVMPDFGYLLGRGLAGFLVVALCMTGLAAYHYAYHFQGSKSIYLMRRLPQRWELLRRCVTAPALGAVAALVLAVVTLFVYYGVYLLVTPASCLMGGQWERLWQYMIGG